MEPEKLQIGWGVVNEHWNGSELFVLDVLGKGAGSVGEQRAWTTHGPPTE